MDTRVRETHIPFGESGSLATVSHMRNVISASIRSPLVVETAHKIAQRFPARAYVRIALGIRDWMKDNFLFVRDPVGVELIRTPEYLLQRYHVTNRVSGDCDDAAVLGCALGKSVGLPCKLVAVGFDQFGTPGLLSHIYGVLLAPNGKRAIPIALDITRPFGATASVRRRLEFPA